MDLDCCMQLIHKLFTSTVHPGQEDLGTCMRCAVSCLHTAGCSIPLCAVLIARSAGLRAQAAADVVVLFCAGLRVPGPDQHPPQRLQQI